MEDECNMDVLRLNHDTPEDFERCLCQVYEGLSLFYIAFQRLTTFYYFGMLVFGLILLMQRPELKILIFFDYWTLILLDIFPQACLHWFGVNKHCYRTNWSYMPWAFKIYWAIFSTALPSTFLSSVIFWTLVYTHKTHIFFMILNTVTPIVIFLQFLSAAFPLRLLHFYFFIIYYTIYIIFTVIYQTLGGTGVFGSIPIYSVLDWRYPGEAVLYTFIGLVIGESFYLIFCLLSMAKLYMRDMYLYE